jgi:hypothetical protein
MAWVIFFMKLLLLLLEFRQPRDFNRVGCQIWSHGKLTHQHPEGNTQIPALAGDGLSSNFDDLAGGANANICA